MNLDPPERAADLEEFLSSHHKTVFVSFGSSFKSADIIVKVVNGLLEARHRGHLNSIVSDERLEPFFTMFEPDARYVSPGHRAPSRRFWKFFFPLDHHSTQAVLGHPNTKLFITDADTVGTNEAVYHSVPILSIPIYLEQHYNAASLREQGVGLDLNSRTFSTNEFSDKIMTIIEDQECTFKQNCARVCIITRHSANMAIKTLIGLVEHVICDPQLRFLRAIKVPPVRNPFEAQKVQWRKWLQGPYAGPLPVQVWIIMAAAGVLISKRLLSGKN